MSNKYIAGWHSDILQKDLGKKSIGNGIYFFGCTKIAYGHYFSPFFYLCFCRLIIYLCSRKEKYWIEKLISWNEFEYNGWYSKICVERSLRFDITVEIWHFSRKILDLLLNHLCWEKMGVHKRNWNWLNKLGLLKVFSWVHFGISFEVKTHV